jgi:hypothetical protein
MENTYSDYWLDDFDFEEVDDEKAINTNLIKLAMARRAISNFVHILTNKSIPVYFNDGGDNCTDGKVVYISSDIINKEDFDPAVGLALHEGSHVLLTNFDIFKTVWQKVPRELYTHAQHLQITKEDVHALVKNMLNYIEDRYIDNYVFNNAPGYRGYYTALYDTYFNSPKIDVMLKSELYRVPSIASYEARIINFNNKNTDLDALPGLRDIAKIINLSDVDRLKTTHDRLQVAYEVSVIILKNIVEAPKRETVPTQNQSQGQETGGSGQQSTGESTTASNTEIFSSSTTNQTNSSTSVDDVLGGEDTTKVTTTKEENVKQDIGEDKNITKNKGNQIRKALEKQRDFLSGNIKKRKVSAKEKKILDAIEKSGMTLVSVGNTYTKSDGSYSVDSIIVKKLTKELINSELFPLNRLDHKEEASTTKEMTEAIGLGFIQGAALGRRLQIRNEVNTCKHMRKPTGRIDKRILSELAFDNENVFYNIDVDRYNKSYIHISVDASSSMNGNKWTTTMTAVVAICKAASMIDNLRVSVSFRSTFNSTKSSNSQLPYVVIAYDSAIDKISKVKNLFPYIMPAGYTPEGLCYESIMDHLPTSTDDNFYFLNFSDGQPYMSYANITGEFISYANENASLHTRQQVNKIRDKGYTILSYFIKDNYESLYNYNLSSVSDELDKVRKQFKTMYGKDASFINVKNIFDIAKTINKMFLDKD